MGIFDKLMDTMHLGNDYEDDYDDYDDHDDHDDHDECEPGQKIPS